MSKYIRMADSAAALDLLQALNTLQQNQVYEEELSFGNRPSNSIPTEQCMNFEIYMSKKTTNPSRKQGKSMKKSVTPLKDTTILTNNRGRSTHNERKSVSPLNHFQQTHEKLKKNLPKNIQKQNLSKNSIEKNESMCSSKLSCQTKKILNEKQKKGKSYVPIHQRAQELLKEREMKLAKLQKEKQLAKMIEEKQCTFKPKIIKSHFKPFQPQIKPQFKKEKKIEQDHSPEQNNHNNECASFSEEQTLKESKTIDKSLDKSVQIAQQTCLTVPDAHKTNEVTVKKYKNEKFNKLLDFLL